MRPERWLYTILLRLRSLFRRRQTDIELDDELRDHVERKTEEYVAKGLPLKDARRQALLEMGGIEERKEECRDTRQVNWIQDLTQDLRYGLRMLRKAPGFTAVAILTLALGIGANTAIFSLLNTLFLQPLPVRDSASLVDIYGTIRGHAYRQLSYPDYLYYRNHAQTVSDLAAQYPTSPINLVVSQQAQEINGSVVTWNYFRLLKLIPALGRFFLPREDEVPGRNPVAVISYGLWQEHFAGDRHVLGKSIDLNGTAFRIVGVAPRNFQGAAEGADATDVWIPSAMFHAGYRYCDAFQRDCRVVDLIGRLKAGHTVSEAQAEMTALAHQLETAYPKTNKSHGVIVVPARGTLPDAQSAESAMLLGTMVILVLMIACANLAGLLLARSVARRREIAVRLSLGASRVRLVRQLLTESLLLSSLGGALGLLVAFWAQSLLMGFYANTGEGNGRTFFPMNLNPGVLLFALCISVLTGVLFGLIPALQASKPNLVMELKEGGSATGARRSRLRSGLVVVQVSVSLLLLIGSGLLAQSLQTIYHGAGFNPSHLLYVRLRPSLVGYGRPEAWAYQREVIRRVEAIPGVIAASPEDYSPIRMATDDVSLWLPGQPPMRREFGYLAGANEVGPRYFETYGVPVLQGREFSEQDQKGSPNVAIANETLARHFWPGASAIGRAIVVDGQTYRIVGVVQNAQYRRIAQQASPFLYTDYWQQDTTDSWAEDSRTLIRVAGDPRLFLPQILKTIAAADPNVPIFTVRFFSDALADQFHSLRMSSTFAICFGALAVLLSAIGLHGILAFYVGQRTREIGIRMALGAERSNVARLILHQGAVLAFAGVGVGVVAALVSVRYLASFLYGVKPYDPLVFAGGAAVTVCVALLACYIPVRRAMKVDPMIALRHE